MGQLRHCLVYSVTHYSLTHTLLQYCVLSTTVVYIISMITNNSVLCHVLTECVSIMCMVYGSSLNCVWLYHDSVNYVYWSGLQLKVST